MNIQYVPAEGWANTFESQLQDKYPNALIEQAPVETLSFDAEKYVAGAELDLSLYTLYPIKNLELEGFRRDPFGGITSAIEDSKKDGEASADVLMQVVFRPEPRNWVHGVNGGPGIDTIAHNLQQPRYEKKRRLFTTTRIEHPPSDIEKKAAKIVRDQHGDRAWNVNIRIFAVSNEEQVARRRVKKAATQFENYYETATEQKFEPIPLKGSDLRDGLDRLITREWEDRGIIKSEAEVAGFVHIPNAEINQQNFNWALSKPGEGVPPGTPRFDFESAGVSEMTSELEKQVAMIDSADVGDPYWYGWGQKDGIEAGVYDEYLNAHQGVFGRTRMGKTVALTNFAGQAMRRFTDDPDADDEGGIIVDPKGQDGDEFIAEWPEDRPNEDLIVVDLDDKNENIPRFNMLEIPSHIEPGTRAFDSYTNAVADVATMMVAEAGGSDNYVGSVMKRVTRTLARGMLKSDRTCTFLDLAAAASYKGNFEQFSEWMDDDRLAFIGQAAERMAEDDNIDLNPLAGRFDEYVQPDSIRSMISAREPSFSIQDAVDNGKWIVLIFPEYAGKTEVTALTNSYMAETYLAKLLSENDAPFHFIGDEVHNFTTGESMLPHILSQGGGLGYRCTLACQSPANQLKDAPAVRDAIQDNVDIWLSFKMPGNSSQYAASQYRETDAEDLENVTRYSAYLVQYTNEAEDIGTLIDTFPPIREVREDVLGDESRTDAELEELKQESMERYGDPLETAEEQAAQSHFYGDEIVSPATDETLQQDVAKAVHDVALRSEGNDLSVPLEKCEDAIRAAVADRFESDMIDTRERLWRNVVKPIPDSKLSESDRDGTLWLSVGEEVVQDIQDVGSDESAGGGLHALVLQDAYPALNELGVSVEIAEQGEGNKSLPDGSIDPTPLLETGPDADPAAIAEAFEDFQEDYPTINALTGGREAVLEAEKSTGSSKQGQTVRNLSSAVSDGQKCLFICRESEAESVWKTLGEVPRGVHNSHTEPGETRFYNLRPLGIDGERVYRDGTREDVWVRNEETGEYILRDGSGNEHARFPDAKSVFTDADRYPSVGDDRDGELRTVKTPIIPEHEFDDGAIPEPGEEWFVIVVPETDGDETLSASDLQLYVDGMKAPLESLGADDGDREESNEESGDVSEQEQGSEPIPAETEANSLDDDGDESEKGGLFRSV
ncbi:type IV secretion system DNA-binding domain-containing protein [Natronococcus sp. JC468]|uniref:type IV secretion system DNA-binding domain-containing protein n=1 Tax=Natronococcus sp. JC468 TaxID=1961921 RepID=UPI00143A1511|nr:type IV secretion system DNA-binding domain-containing protein [Natronococcus sp. JC468]NKE37316.1 type IV secretion system DNA-binding domain-containing protein [Natronococcus sp. JC468]